MIDSKGDKGDKGDKGEKGDQGVRSSGVSDWFAAREPTITFTFFLILSVLSFSTILVARQTRDTIEKTDIIVQCTTPGTQCYKLSQEAAQKRLAESKAAVFCIIDVVTAFPLSDWQAHREQLLASYGLCVAKASNS